uniref:Uncharacterized protein n=1 Tax=Salix viminalis TaxID=40686 RepID=A0A6N2NCT7_SALVM
MGERETERKSEETNRKREGLAYGCYGKRNNSRGGDGGHGCSSRAAVMRVGEVVATGRPWEKGRRRERGHGGCSSPHGGWRLQPLLERKRCFFFRPVAKQDVNGSMAAARDLRPSPLHPPATSSHFSCPLISDTLTSYTSHKHTHTIISHKFESSILSPVAFLNCFFTFSESGGEREVSNFEMGTNLFVEKLATVGCFIHRVLWDVCLKLLHLDDFLATLVVDQQYRVLGISSFIWASSLEKQLMPKNISTSMWESLP